MSASPLDALFITIDERVAAIRSDHPDWRCAKGCDNCCRQLAAPPQLSREEWRRLASGLERLPAAQQQEIKARVTFQAPQPIIAKDGYTCPLLDSASGCCPVYHDRPVACRSYGYYQQRDKGLFCNEILQSCESGKLDGVIWGNHDAIDRDLAQLGESRSLAEWFAEPDK